MPIRGQSVTAAPVRGGIATVGVRALVDIAPATTLRLRYGELSNEELLLGSGFVLYHNPFDRLVVRRRIGGRGVECDGIDIDLWHSGQSRFNPLVTPHEN